MQSFRIVMLATTAAVALAVGACSNSDGTSTLLDRGSCDVLIACAGELTPELRDAYDETYGAFGTCWQGGFAQWPQCRDACATSLEAINLNAQASGESCGQCTLHADCAAFGATAYCDEGLCAGGSSSGTAEGGETGGPNDPSDPTTGDGDGDPTTGDGDGDGDPTTGDGDGDGTPPLACGWYEDPDFPGYYCGGLGMHPDYPRECPSGLVEGAPCGEVTGIGCCDIGDNNWYCGDDGQGNLVLVREICQ